MSHSNIHTHLLKILPQHLANLRASGLSDETIIRCGFCSVIDKGRAARLLRWRGPARDIGPCLAIPFPHAPGYVRLKPDRPRRDGKDKPIKYESPVGQPNRAYFPPDTLPVLSDPSVPLIITEGEKKAAKADQEGFPCIGLVGVYGWQRKRRPRADGELFADRDFRDLIDDLKTVRWRGRTVYIVYDSDAAENADVQKAAKHLAEALADWGAHVTIAFLPHGPAKVGLDDFLVAHGANGPDALRAFLRDPPDIPPARPRRQRSGTDGAAVMGETFDDLGSPAAALIAQQAADTDSLQSAEYRAVAEQIRLRQSDERCQDAAIAIQRHRTLPQVAERFIRCGKCAGCRRHKVRRWLDNATFRLSAQHAPHTVWVGVIAESEWPVYWGRIRYRDGEYLWARVDFDTIFLVSSTPIAGFAEVASAEALAQFKTYVTTWPGGKRLAGSSRAWQIPKVDRPRRNEWETIGRGCPLTSGEAKDRWAAQNGVNVILDGPDAEPPNRVVRTRRYLFPPLFTRYQKRVFIEGIQTGRWQGVGDIENVTEPIPMADPDAYDSPLNDEDELVLTFT